MEVSSVAADKDRVFLGTSSGHVVSVDAVTGLVRWATDVSGVLGEPSGVSGLASGKPGLFAGTTTGFVVALDPEGDYAWNLWRPYQCCEKEGQFFLFDINWINYPP